MSGRADGPIRVVVVGGGITGLAAAWEATNHPGVSVTLLESSHRFGGKVRTSALDLPTGPLVVDEGADNFLARVPDAVDLCEELGLGDHLTQPSVGRAAVWAGDAVRPFPARHVLGVPLDVGDLSATGIVSADALQQIASEPERFAHAAPPSGDVTIGGFLRERLGDEVVEHVVGPLVGGINAGDVDELSLRAVTPQLAAAADDGGSIVEALRSRAAAAPPTGPVFRALLGGTETLVTELVDQLRTRGAVLRTGVDVVAVRTLPGGSVVSDSAINDPTVSASPFSDSAAIGSDDPRSSGRHGIDRSGPDHGERDRRPGVVVSLADGTTIDADAVVVATPAPAAAELLSGSSPSTAGWLRRIVHVSVAFVTLALPRRLVDLPEDMSGLLVPRDAGLLATAVSFGSNKWPQWNDGSHTILRVAAGHRHDDRPSSMDDDELVAALLPELSRLLGTTAAPVAARVTRWSPGFAQYQIGHLDLLERISDALRGDLPSVRVAGADLGGLGLPACIAQGRAAARDLLS